MDIKSTFAVILIAVGAILALFVRGIIKGQKKRIDLEEDDGFFELLTMSSNVFVLMGLAIAAAGVILYFIN